MIVFSYKNPKRNGKTDANVTNSTYRDPKKILEENHLFNEMVADLEKYRSEVTEWVMRGKKIVNASFKKTFFASLEGLLNQVSFIVDKKLKEEKIENIYNWYKTKLKYFHDLNDITRKTKKFHWENHPNLDDFRKSDYYQAAKFPLYYESENRTEERGIMPPKDR